jgi:TP53 regulating kinase-like protein
MEFIQGTTVRDYLKNDHLDSNLISLLAQAIGKTIAELHKNQMIHGDLTTSNMMLRNNELVMIDFGLGFQSSDLEDKAVDLYVLQRAVESTHPDYTDLFNQISNEYFKHEPSVLKRFNQVQMRGRKRS